MNQIPTPPPPPPNYQPTSPTRRRALIFGSCIAILVIGAAWLGLAVWQSVRNLGALPTNPAEQFEETVVREDGSDKIAVVDIHGVILSEAPDGTSAEQIIKMLDRAAEDDDVKAVIVDIDSPGGGVVPSRQIYDKIAKVRESKPVIALYSGDVAASGGVYVSMAASKIISDPETLTGSIGVIAETVDISGLLEKYGVKFNTIKSGKFKDIGSFSRAMTDEERALLQELIDESYERFVQVVAESRNKSVDQVKEFADGRIYSANKALGYGMIDQVGDFDEAEAAAKELAKIESATIIEYQPHFDFGSLFGLASSKMSSISELELIKQYHDANLRLMYLME